MVACTCPENIAGVAAGAEAASHCAGAEAPAHCASAEAAGAEASPASAGLPPIAPSAAEAAGAARSPGREGVEGGQIHSLYCVRTRVYFFVVMLLCGDVVFSGIPSYLVVAVCGSNEGK